MEFAERPSDCYGTPRRVLDLVESYWPSGIDLDPFWDPQCLVEARECWDVRQGQDAYRLAREGRLWGRVWANGPYHGDGPKRTAKILAQYADSGGEALNLTPCGPGLHYWRRSVWPFASAIAWLGRLSFRAGRDRFKVDRLGEHVLDKHGEPILTHRAGEIVKGADREVALVAYNGDPHRFRCVFETIGGYPVVTRGAW